MGDEFANKDIIVYTLEEVEDWKTVLMSLITDFPLRASVSPCFY
jgi:hypothetical protein